MAVRRKPIIGLLGGIGAGKSTVAAELARLGCGVIDADRLGHELLEDSKVKTRLRWLWGQGIFDAEGRIDRQALAGIVFKNEAALSALNTVMHPRIRRGIIQRIKQLKRQPRIKAVVVDAALLLETDWYDLCTQFIFVSAPPRARARRAAKARGWSLPDWKRREKSQKPLDIKASRADYIVDNSSSVSRLRQQVRAVLRRMLEQTNRS